MPGAVPGAYEVGDATVPFGPSTDDQIDGWPGWLPLADERAIWSAVSSRRCPTPAVAEAQHWDPPRSGETRGQ